MSNVLTKTKITVRNNT